MKSESEVAQSCLTLRDPNGLQPIRLLCPWDFPGKSTGTCIDVGVNPKNENASTLMLDVKIYLRTGFNKSLKTLSFPYSEFIILIKITYHHALIELKTINVNFFPQKIV